MLRIFHVNVVVMRDESALGTLPDRKLDDSIDQYFACHVSGVNASAVFLGRMSWGKTSATFYIFSGLGVLWSFVVDEAWIGQAATCAQPRATGTQPCCGILSC